MFVELLIKIKCGTYICCSKAQVSSQYINKILFELIIFLFWVGGKISKSGGIINHMDCGGKVTEIQDNEPMPDWLVDLADHFKKVPWHS